MPSHFTHLAQRSINSPQRNKRNEDDENIRRKNPDENNPKNSSWRRSTSIPFNFFFFFYSNWHISHRRKYVTEQFERTVTDSFCLNSQKYSHHFECFPTNPWTAFNVIIYNIQFIKQLNRYLRIPVAVKFSYMWYIFA